MAKGWGRGKRGKVTHGDHDGDIIKDDGNVWNYVAVMAAQPCEEY